MQKRVVCLAVVLAIIRIWIGLTVEPDVFSWVAAYKDMAHIFMGGLGVAWWLEQKRWQSTLFVAMTALEVAVAGLSRI